jgi:hypothetical protein
MRRKTIVGFTIELIFHAEMQWCLRWRDAMVSAMEKNYTKVMLETDHQVVVELGKKSRQGNTVEGRC